MSNINDQYSFTSKFTREEDSKISELAEEFFDTENDYKQMPMSEITYEVVHDRYPGSLFIIKHIQKIIGFTFLLPTTNKMMQDFLDLTINEKELLTRILEQVTMENCDSLYLVAAFIEPSHRNKGLVISSFTEQIKKFSNWKNMNLFCWTTTEEWRKMVLKLSKSLAIKIKDRTQQ